MNRIQRVLYDLRYAEYRWLREAQRLLSYPLFHIRHGRPERVDAMRGHRGEYIIKTSGGSVLRLVIDPLRAPRALLRRWPGPGAAESPVLIAGSRAMAQAHTEGLVGQPTEWLDDRKS